MQDYEAILNEQLSKKDFICREYFSCKAFGQYKIIVYGAGGGLTTLNIFVLERFHIPVEVILDKKFKDEQCLCGIRSCHPERYIPSAEELEKGLVIVTIGDSATRQEIIASMRQRGFRNVVSAMDIYEFNLPNPSPELNSGYLFYHNSKEDIFHALSLFDDETSRAVFFNFLQVHLIRQNCLIPSCPHKEQYIAPDIFIHPDRSRYICCGAYDGDNIINFYEKYGRFSAVACFEPDQDNFTKLIQTLQPKCGKFADELILYPCGVFWGEQQRHFMSGYTTNSMISECGNVLIQCVAMDHVIRNFRPTFLSMDIEGSELSALKGATGIITESKPDLAVCVYHSPEHLWTIPLFLHKLVPDYHFYLRNYTSFTSETVLYATVNA